VIEKWNSPPPHFVFELRKGMRVEEIGEENSQSE